MPYEFRILGPRPAPPSGISWELSRVSGCSCCSGRAALAADYRQVAAEDPVAGRVLPLLGRLDPDATGTPEGLAGALGEDPSRVFFALERLVDAWLAKSPKPGHYRTTGLARAFAAELADAADQQLHAAYWQGHRPCWRPAS